jgi:hypothetical protein
MLPRIDVFILQSQVKVAGDPVAFYAGLVAELGDAQVSLEDMFWESRERDRDSLLQEMERTRSGQSEAGLLVC